MTTILFVHGAPMNATTWRGVIARLNDRYRCVAPDLPGYGAEPALQAPMGVAQAADALVDWVDRSELDDLIVVMNDTGGAVGTALAVRRPDKIRGLVAVDALGFSLAEFGYVRFMLALLSAAPIRALLERVNLFEWVLRAGGLPKLDRAERDALLGIHRTRSGRRRFLDLLGSLVRQTGFLAELDRGHARLADRPVLTVFGSHDPARLAGFPERWARSFSNCEHVIVPGGHFSHEDSPVAVADAIDTWLARQA